MTIASMIVLYLAVGLTASTLFVIARKILRRLDAIEGKRMEVCHLCRGWFESTLRWHEIYVVKTHVHNGEKWIPKTERIPVSHDLCSACFAKKQAEDEEKKSPPFKTSSDTTP